VIDDYDDNDNDLYGAEMITMMMIMMMIKRLMMVMMMMMISDECIVFM